MQDQVSGLKSKGIKAEMLFEKSTPDQLKYVGTIRRQCAPNLC